MFSPESSGRMDGWMDGWGYGIRKEGGMEEEEGGGVKSGVCVGRWVDGWAGRV